MIPQYYNLIKDPKRFSLVFKSKKKLFAFVNELRGDNLFGIDFEKEMHFEDSQLYIRVKEVKNGFLTSKKGA